MTRSAQDKQPCGDPDAGVFRGDGGGSESPSSSGEVSGSPLLKCGSSGWRAWETAPLTFHVLTSSSDLAASLGSEVRGRDGPAVSQSAAHQSMSEPFESHSLGQGGRALFTALLSKYE